LIYLVVGILLKFVKPFSENSLSLLITITITITILYKMPFRDSVDIWHLRNNIKIMKYPLRNLIFEKIKQAGNMTDSDLMNSLNKDGVSLTEADLNKTLLDLEIYGLIKVSWITKEKRRIESVVGSPV
jgi:hypothetical protein